MKDTMKTDVLFLSHPDDDLFAYFPNEEYYGTETGDITGYNFDHRMRVCYAHIGQHSACHPDYAKECKEATDYQELKEELESIGYNLNILNK
jgi:hypothetical protein